MSRYEPLTRFLEGQRGTEAPLSFGEVERILGRPLPQSARRHQAWWSNTETHSHAEAWLRAGWKTARLDMGDERVVFVQGAPKSPAKASPVGLTPMAAKFFERYQAENGLTKDEAISALINEAAIRKRRELLDWFAKNARPSTSDSVAMIREDRDGR